jgi:hypothetical protein
MAFFVGGIAIRTWIMHLLLCTLHTKSKMTLQYLIARIIVNRLNLNELFQKKKNLCRHGLDFVKALIEIISFFF